MTYYLDVGQDFLISLLNHIKCQPTGFLKVNQEVQHTNAGLKVEITLRIVCNTFCMSSICCNRKAFFPASLVRGASVTDKATLNYVYVSYA